MRSLPRRLLLASILGSVVAVFGACGVEFEPDRFCWKCEDDEDCGAGYTCRPEGSFGYCIEPDWEEGRGSPCDSADRG